MKKLLVIGLLAAALAAVLPALAGASGVGDSKGPNCADITGGSGTWGFSGPDQVTVIVTYDASVCKSVVYAATATTATGDVQLTQVAQPDATTLVFQGIVDHTTNSSVCVSASTASNGGHVRDTAPDSGCIALPYLGSPGFGNFS